MEFKVGQRLHADEYGNGRVTGIDKFYAIVYMEWDEPHDKHGTRKLALPEEWVAKHCGPAIERNRALEIVREGPVAGPGRFA